MDQSLVATIRQTLADRPTADLRQAYESGDHSRWSPEAFEAMRQILEERGTGPDPPPPAPPPAPAVTAARGPAGRAAGNFFLVVGAIICLVSCALAVVSTVGALVASERVAVVVPLSARTGGLLAAAILLDGCVWFSLSAALFVVFQRALPLGKSE